MAKTKTYLVTLALVPGQPDPSDALEELHGSIRAELFIGTHYYEVIDIEEEENH